jgi:hypothetical protein
MPRRRSRWRTAAVPLLVLLVVLVGARLALPSVVRDYVNHTLDRSPIYDGTVRDVTLHLWRGAYTIEDVRIVKTTGNVPVPFFAADRLDLSIEWRALMSGEVVGTVRMDRPELNFVDADDDSQDQTGAGGPWLDMLGDLFPFDINSAVIRDGSVHFRAFQTDEPVDVYLSRVEADVANLTNIHEDVTPLFATVTATAVAMDHAHVEYEMSIDPQSYRPTFQLALRLLGLDVTRTNALARAYGKVDFESGRFDLVVEMDAKEGAVTGYVKPLYHDLEVIDLREDLRDRNFLWVFWEAVVGGVTTVFENQPREQLATVIPFSGDLSAPDTEVLTAIGNLLRNAFVRAYLPELQGTPADDRLVRFGAARPPEGDVAASRKRRSER